MIKFSQILDRHLVVNQQISSTQLETQIDTIHTVKGVLKVSKTGGFGEWTLNKWTTLLGTLQLETDRNGGSHLKTCNKIIEKIFFNIKHNTNVRDISIVLDFCIEVTVNWFSVAFSCYYSPNWSPVPFAIGVLLTFNFGFMSSALQFESGLQ